LIAGGASLQKGLHYGFENTNDFHNKVIKNLGQVLTHFIESGKTRFGDEDLEMLKQKLVPKEIALACE
jgi:hypothetical protein